ncbi:hypothetical protein F0562_006387 [Nyssa sinensis]|uniref:Replication factor C C-terminal domain-containing protein n=1 Tax=Nyssa sinensis TaxID=561372 RepID=A0A5J5AQ34_9ASTE|nr:hypothetical protein F0562_006387 [Nyssa sinensis]
MENSSRHSKPSQPQSSLATTLKQIRSGYEPSDTETEWYETPWHDHTRRNEDLGSEGPKMDMDQARKTSPFKLSRRHSARHGHEVSSLTKTATTSPIRRRHSKSPFKPRRDDGNVHSPTPISDFRRNISPLSPRPGLDVRKNISPFTKSERRRHVSPYKPLREEHGLDNDEIVSLNRKQNPRQHNKYLGPEEKGGQSQLNEIRRASEKSNYSRRALSAPKQRGRDKDQQIKYGHTEQKGDRTPSPLPKNMPQKEREASYTNAPSVGEINEMVANTKISSANTKISRHPVTDAPNFESTESISPGDIFFSRDYAALTMQKIIFPKNGGPESRFDPKPKMFTNRDSSPCQKVETNSSFDHKTNGISSSTVQSGTTTASSAVSRQSSGKISTSSKMSDASGRTSGSWRKFTANRRKSQTEAWFSCIKGSCRTAKSLEKNREIDEASFIEKAFVVENLRQFWADKHQPSSLKGFTCHKQEAQLLEQLVSYEVCPHILLKGSPGSGKRALTMAVLHEIYGDPAWNISHDLRYFHIQEARPIQVVVPVTSSAHHMELNVYLEPNAGYALMALVKQINSNYEITPEISNANFKADYKVMVLYDVDKAVENIQHLIKWIMDCYTDSCKLILCCEDDVDILESVKNRCKVIKVDAPVTHEIMEVLIQIAKKEGIDLSMSFAAKIATKSKQNLRKAIMALEACKAHNYPFVEDQPIPLGWEEVLQELAAEILADPSTKRLFYIRGKIQKLLMDFVHPKLILQKLVEQFLKGIEASLRRELYYWHAYYDKRLPTGASALVKLEEFVAKFMGICRKSSNNRQYS